MQTRSTQLREHCLTITWSDGSSSDFPYQFLRDNDPRGFHPETQERVLDLLSVPETLKAQSANVMNDALEVDWGAGTAATSLPLQWLYHHRPGLRTEDPADIPFLTWGSEMEARLPRFAATALAQGSHTILEWLTATKRFGLSVVEGLNDDEDAGVAIGTSVGFLRQTNFGVTFRVETKPGPNNLAYTSQALPLHTDLPNQELPPGFQFLHCVRNEATGGGSVFADAFRIAENVRNADEPAFQLLSSIPIPYRFQDREFDIRIHRPLIGLDERSRVFDIRYSAHLMAAFDMPADTMVAYYRAFRRFMTAAKGKHHALQASTRRDGRLRQSSRPARARGVQPSDRPPSTERLLRRQG